MKRRTSQIEKQQEQLDDHIDHTEYNDGENMFSRALLNLSFNDRSMIEEEIHGVSCMYTIDETPELIEESLYQFDLELDLIDNEDKVAYNKAKEISMSMSMSMSSSTSTMSTEDDADNHPSPTQDHSNSNSKSSSSSYLLCKENKLRFLRSEFFDPRKSASRFTKYIDLLLEVYGEYALRRPIRMQDFNREELSFLKSGQYQLLPFRDRGGRRVMAVVPNNKDHVPMKVLLKVFLYLWFVCVGGDDTSNNDSNNVETQRKGIVIVGFPSGQDVFNINESDNNDLYSNDDAAIKAKANENHTTAQWTKNRLEANSIIAKVVPLRVAAIHMCLPNSRIFKVVASVYGIALKVWSARTKIHLGNPIEIRYKLQQYGIPIELLPSTDTGNIKSVNLRHWMKLRKHLECEKQKSYSSDSDNSNSGGGYDSGGVSTTSSTITTTTTTTIHDIVECPLSNDVIFRRGKTMNVHSGNVKFQNLIESRIYEHSIDLNTPPLRRTEIEIELMNEVQIPEQGVSGRFLTWNIEKKWWLVIRSDDEKQKKIHYAFRDFQKKMLKTKQQQQKVQTTPNSNSLFVRQDGQKKKMYIKNKRDNDIENRSSSEDNAFRDFQKTMLKTKQQQQQQQQQKVQTTTHLNSLFEGQQDGQKKKLYIKNKRDNVIENRSSSEDNNNNGCANANPFFPSMDNNGNNKTCGFFFSTDDSSYAYLGDGFI